MPPQFRFRNPGAFDCGDNVPTPERSRPERLLAKVVFRCKHPVTGGGEGCLFLPCPECIHGLRWNRQRLARRIRFRRLVRLLNTPPVFIHYPFVLVGTPVPFVVVMIQFAGGVVGGFAGTKVTFDPLVAFCWFHRSIAPVPCPFEPLVL